MGEEKLTEQELKILNDALNEKKDKIQKLEAIMQETKLAEAAAKIADLSYQVTIRHLYIKYGLTFDDSVDQNTGLILRKQDEVKEKE